MNKHLISRLSNRHDFTLINATVRTTHASVDRVQLYAIGDRAVMLYRLAYAPDSFLVDVAPSDMNRIKTLVYNEQTLLANMRKRRLPDDGSLELALADRDDPELTKIVGICNAHRTRQHLLTAASAMAPPDSEDETIALFAKIVAESHMAAYAFDYYVMKAAFGVDWALPCFVDVGNPQKDPALPPFGKRVSA